MSYFAKPNFIVYDEWFDEDLEKTKNGFKNKKNKKNKIIKTTSNIHEFFYEKSNYKIGASENHFKSDMKVHTKELITNQYPYNIAQKYFSVSSKKYNLFQKLTKSKLQFNLTKKIIYTLSILSFTCIFGFVIFFISQTKKNEPTLTNKFPSLEKNF